MPEIRKIVLSSGKVRYRAVVDIGRDPETGRRLQKTITLDGRKDVVDEIARITHQRRIGTTSSRPRSPSTRRSTGCCRH